MQSALLSPRFARALQLTCELHTHQRRKGTTIPYLAHLISVCALVLEHGGSEDAAIAALLHDAVEDQGGAPTLKRIRSEFGESVAAIVAGCSDCEAYPKPPWLQRKRAYIQHIASATFEVRLVSAADKLHNLRSSLADYRQLDEELWSRFNGKKEGTLWYYRALTDAFQANGSSPFAAELERTMCELETLSLGPNPSPVRTFEPQVPIDAEND